MLRKRFDELRDRRTTAQANLKNVESSLEKLKAQAREKYNTDDPAELQRLLEQMREENEKKRADYQEHLDDIQTKLDDLENKEVAG
jgi:chromosome segregation ATPase